MENLPAELIEHIALYLTSEDVLNCSNVSAQWNEIFNLDRVWKRFLTYDISYFKNKSSRLNFTLSRTELEVEPCQCKDSFLKESFIKQNVLQGNFLIEEIDIGASYVECGEEDVDGWGNHWLFLSVLEGVKFQGIHKIQVWNLNSSLYLQSSVVTSFDARRPIDSKIKVFDDKVFYVKEDIVWVYNFAHPKFEFRFLFKIEPLTCVYPFGIYITNKMVCLPTNILYFSFSHVHINQNHCPFFEMWNHAGIQVAHNFKELAYQLEIILEDSCSSALHVRILDGNNILVLYQYYKDRYKFALTVFDCSKSNYNDIFIEQCGIFHSFDVHGQIVVILYNEQDQFGQKILCIDIEIGSKLFCCNAKFETTPCISFIKSIQFALNGDLVIMGTNKLYNFNVTKTGLKYKISVELSKRHRPSDVRALNNNFMILFNSQGKGSYELFNYETGVKMYNIPLEMPNLILSSWKNKSPPTDLIAYASPNVVYAHRTEHKSIFIIHFY